MSHTAISALGQALSLWRKLFRACLRGALVTAALLVAPAQIAYAQSLDVAGFNIRLGDSFENTLRRLSSVYELQNLQGMISSPTNGKMWWIRQRGGDRTILGGIDEKDGKVVAVRRNYSGDNQSTSLAFVQYLLEARRLSGAQCVTTPDFVLDPTSGALSQVTGYTTTCGHYHITHGVPWRPEITTESLELAVW